MTHIAPRLLVAQEATEGGLWMTSPGIGYHVGGPRPGTRLSAGDEAGFLVVLQRAYPLCVPSGAGGVAVDPRSGHRRQPVQFGDRLFRLAPHGEVETSDGTPAAEGVEDYAGAYQVRAPLGGTFYRSPQPGAPAFVEVGQEVAGSARLCIIEAMKVMNQLRLDDLSGAPARARVEAIVAQDASPVALGDALIILRDLG